MKKGFTLVELLVVVAIIAALSAGVLVTYQHVDDRARTAAELSDVAALAKTIAVWSVGHGGRLPDELDTLVTTGGELYSEAVFARGLSGDLENTLEVAAPPDAVRDGLDAAGITRVYLHDTERPVANESAHDGQYDTAATRRATRGTNDVAAVGRLAFVCPRGGVPGEGNVSTNLILAAGLRPAQVASPAGEPAAGETHYLVAFGLGRFASIYSGDDVRVDTPAAGKRAARNPARYSRYIMLVKVPVTFTRAARRPSLGCVITSQGHTLETLAEVYAVETEQN